jgi:predicted aspartyl protease
MKGIYFLEFDDDTVVEDDDDDPQISLLAMTGIKSGGTIQLATTVAKATMTALIDSGSTHCFMATATADRLGLTPSPRPGMTVAVANGERVPTSGV